MTQPSPTPVPDHGTGWGLLLLFAYLYGIVGILGSLTIVTIGLRYINKRVPQPLQYLSVVVLLGALGLSGFVLLVAATAKMYEVVGLLLLIVVTPLAYVMVTQRGTKSSRLTIITHAGMVWSIPFLVGFGVIALGSNLAGNIPPEVTGLVAVIIVVVGTIVLDRRPLFSVGE